MFYIIVSIYFACFFNRDWEGHMLSIRNKSTISSNAKNNSAVSYNTKQMSFRGGRLFTAKAGVDCTQSLWTMFDKFSGFATALVSMAGFALGGAGLLYDYFYKKKHHIKNLKTQKFLTSPVFAKFNMKLDPQKTSDEGKEVGHIQPVTKLGKIGLTFAKIGIGFSGIAGIFNGIAMRLPLMSAGESMNLAASPIINTQIGFGFFNIGLAAIFAGRALESDPILKLDPATYASQDGLQGKIKYVIKNMNGCINEVLCSTKTLFSNMIKLCFPGEKGIAARNFFKDQILSVRSSTIIFKESLLANGKVKVTTGMKSYPFRMHTASVILAVGGLALIITDILHKMKIFKGKTAKHSSIAAFKIAEAGGCLDNLGLAYYGMEKMSLGQVSSGIPLALSGFTILSGTPHAEKDYGRALQWIGCAALFATFAIERKQELVKAFANRVVTDKEVTEATNQLIRQWEIHIPDSIDRKYLKRHLTNIINLTTKHDDAIAAENILKTKFNNIVNTDELRNTIETYADVNDKSKLKTSLLQISKQQSIALQKLDKVAQKEFKQNMNSFITYHQAKSTIAKDENVRPILDLIDTIKSELDDKNFKLDPNTNEILNRRIANLNNGNTFKITCSNRGNADELLKASSKAVIGVNIGKFGENYMDELAEIVRHPDTLQSVREIAKSELTTLIERTLNNLRIPQETKNHAKMLKSQLEGNYSGGENLF